MPQLKRKQVRVYLEQDEERILAQLTSATSMTETGLLNLIVSAGLRCARDADYRLVIPLNFTFAEPAASAPSRQIAPSVSRARAR